MSYNKLSAKRKKTGPRRPVLFTAESLHGRPPFSTSSSTAAAPPRPHREERSHRGGGPRGRWAVGGDAGEPEREAEAPQGRDHSRARPLRRPRRRPEEAAGEPGPPQRQEPRGACGVLVIIVLKMQSVVRVSVLGACSVE